MTAPIQIRRPDVVDKIRRLSRLRGMPITDVIDSAVDAALSEREAEIEAKLKEVREIVRRFNALPTVGPILTDDDLYDEDGLPK